MRCEDILNDDFSTYETIGCPGGFTYTIVRGDTLYNLARRYNTSVRALLEANPGINPNNLQIGQTICIPVPPPPIPCPAGIIYTIKPGDTLFAISIRHDISLHDLLLANPGIDPVTLQVGQQICIPEEPQVPVCPNGLYTIQPGDTFASIARFFGITVEELIRLNPGVDYNRLAVGMQICLPLGTPGPCPGGTIYRAKPGDTFTSIARQFNLSIQELRLANPQIVDINQIGVNQSICIPPRR